MISTLSQHPHSTVWLAEHISLSVPRIIKGIPKSFYLHDELIREAHLMKHLNHPGIPIIYDIFEDELYTYIVEQYIRGVSLEALVSKRLLSEKEVFLFIIRICSIIEYLHTDSIGILHLDIKPANIIISENNPVLVDFGNATTLGEQNTRVNGYSREYAPPEQRLGLGVGRASDVYALGKLIKFLVAHSNMRESLRTRLLRIVSLCVAPVSCRIMSADILRKMLEGMYDLETNHIRTGKKCRRQKEKGVKRIGLAGLESGVGVTHIALCLASYLADRCCLEVRLTERTGRSDYSFVDQEKAPGITFARGTDKPCEAECRLDEYDYEVCDLGCISDSNRDFLKQCDMKIVIGSAAPWHIKQYDILPPPDERNNSDRGWYILANLANPNHKSRAGHAVIPFPPETDPLHPGTETCRLFERMMK